MTASIELKEEKERILMVGVSTREGDDTEQSLDELSELISTAGGEAVGRLVQSREAPHPATYVGKGKLEEIRTLACELGAAGIACDDELSPAQYGNLQDLLGLKIMDRTMIILDIFAMRASTSEGKLQVELAQLKYRMARLTGYGISLSRLGGGIGTRGPGEKKLEVDRRRIRQRISWLNRELGEVKRHREVARGKRSKNHMPVAAIVGYTNAGKSTLLNKLTGAGVFAEDKLFATLDPTTRVLALESGQQILLTDTVGFIKKLPHHLIEAFRSTLEEAKYADIILHVVDASSPHAEQHMHTVYETLQELGVRDKTIVTLLNKQDKLKEQAIVRDFHADKTLYLSARTGEGLLELKSTLEDILRGKKIYIERKYPYGEAGKISLIRKYGELLEESFEEDGIGIKAYVPAQLYRKVSDS